MENETGARVRTGHVLMASGYSKTRKWRDGLLVDGWVNGDGLRVKLSQKSCDRWGLDHLATGQARLGVALGTGANKTTCAGDSFKYTTCIHVPSPVEKKLTTGASKRRTGRQIR